MKIILQENNDPNIDYDAVCYCYKCGHRITVGYIHDLQSENPGIELTENIISINMLEILINQIKGIKNG